MWSTSPPTETIVISFFEIWNQLLCFVVGFKRNGCDVQSDLVSNHEDVCRTSVAFNWFRVDDAEMGRKTPEQEEAAHGLHLLPQLSQEFKVEIRWSPNGNVLHQFGDHHVQGKRRRKQSDALSVILLKIKCYRNIRTCQTSNLALLKTNIIFRVPCTLMYFKGINFGRPVSNLVILICVVLYTFRY